MNLDKNQVIGFTLISLLLIGYMFYQEAYGPKPELTKPTTTVTTPEVGNTPPLITDSTETISAEEQLVSIETDLLKFTFSSNGADIKSAILKKYEDHNDQPLELVDENNFDFNVAIGDKNTNKLPFNITCAKTTITGEEETTVTLKNNDIVISYTFKGNSYKVDYNIKANAGTAKTYSINWAARMKRVELGLDESYSNSSLNYYSLEGDFDEVGTGTSNDDEDVKEPLKWISFKQRFFNIGLITEKQYNSAKFQTFVNKEDSLYFKSTSADIVISTKGPINDNFSFYFGPNDYKVLKEVTAGYHENLNLGWGIFGWINKYMVIPVFKFLENHFTNYGIIILVLVLIIKMLLFPIAYKSYLAMAKMKELKPEIDEIKARVGDDMQKQQQETMKLYSQVGVNPISGCIPTVLQMPFLFAMFRFFPNSIELRHQSFLWAHDLSTYDDPINWGTYIWPIGDHISVFCLLMTITSVAYAYYNNQMNTAATGPMKNIGYIMPVVFFFVLNNFSSGLTFYYFVSTLITIIQQQLATSFIDKGKIRAAMEENKKNAGTKKTTGFRARIDSAMKAAQEQQSQKKNKK